jgi:hypothetical protein
MSIYAQSATSGRLPKALRQRDFVHAGYRRSCDGVAELAE